jgi:hypothetical protein
MASGDVDDLCPRRRAQVVRRISHPTCSLARSDHSLMELPGKRRLTGCE